MQITLFLGILSKKLGVALQDVIQWGIDIALAIIIALLKILYDDLRKDIRDVKEEASKDRDKKTDIVEALGVDTAVLKQGQALTQTDVSVLEARIEEIRKNVEEKHTEVRNSFHSLRNDVQANFTPRIDHFRLIDSMEKKFEAVEKKMEAFDKKLSEGFQAVLSAMK